jgi:hypothetical protein
MAIMDWSTSANSNSVVGSINWSEGQAPSTVNNSARQMMADVASWTNNPGPEWYQYDSATYASGTTFTLPGNVAFRYVEGRRLRCVVTGGTFFGSVLSSTFSTNTTVTAVWDSGSLDAGLSSIKLSVISPTAMPTKNVVQHIDNTVSISVSSGVQAALTLQGTFTSIGAWLRCSAGAKLMAVNSSSQFYIANSANTLAIMTLTDAGAATFTGDVTANSDESLKHKWRDLPANFIEQLSEVKAGTFERIDQQLGTKRHVGVGAQSLQTVLPEAVMENESGVLSVAYGNAALATCVMLAREVVALKRRIEELEGEQ